MPYTRGSTKFSNFTYGACVGPGHQSPLRLQRRRGCCQRLDAHRGDLQRCDREALLTSGSIVLESGGGQVVCFRWDEDTLENVRVERVLSAFHLTAVNEELVDIIAYSWDIQE